MKLVILIIPLLAFACSCNKSNYQSDLAASAVEEATRNALTNWVATNGIDVRTNAGLSNALVAFPYMFKTSVTNELYLESIAAGSVLEKKWNEGSLPGVSKEDHGDLTLDPLDSIISNKVVIITYPATRVFHLEKSGETSTNYYTLVKESRNAKWELQKAWETDSNGQIIREWPIK